LSFIHLHNHSQFSLLDGAARIKDLVNRAAELNMSALAITDHGNLYGVLEFYIEAKEAKIKPIIGMEAYIAPAERSFRKPIDGESHSYHLVLLAKNETGFRNLMKLSSLAFLEGFYHRPRIDKAILRQYSEGLIATSACMKGEIAWRLQRGQREQAIRSAEEYMEIFGSDFYLEIQEHHIPGEAAVYNQIYQLAQTMGIPVIATNDTHYLSKGDHEAHDILLCLQTGKDRDDPNRLRYGTEELYLKSPDEMFRLFSDRPQVLERTLEIGEKVNLKIDLEQRLLPRFPIPPGEGNIDADEYLERLTLRGAEKRYPHADSKVMDRINYELGVIRQTGFAGYFLIVQDFINAAREKDIPVGLGRGSAAGSIVAYTLGITDVEPLKYGLIFERFLNPERVSMPDIDIDFCMERRGEVIDYVRGKYGKNNVSQIITFGTMAARGVIRDVSRTLKIPISVADKIAKMIPHEGAKPMPLKKAFAEIPELKEIAESEDPQLKELVRFAPTLEGLNRNISTHAAGIIITPDDTMNYVPLYKNPDTNDISTQWTMGWCEKIGLLKMDFLGLRNLTVIQKAERMISKKLGHEFKVQDVPLDDFDTYRLFGEGSTVGVFQFESSGMQEYLKKLKPTRIEDLIALNALYRPGPMDMIDGFIDRKYGRAKIEYLHPSLEPILEETYGVIVYQEQVMRIAADLAGFSLAQADIMRKAMGKKQKDVMAEQKKRFIEGCLKNGIEKKIASDIADLIEKFAEYGFNKSHSAAYAIIAYQTAYLKTHYPSEFMAANLTSEVGDGGRIMILMDDCRKFNLNIKPPDVNYSEAHFVPVDDNTIAFGMEAIKNVGGGAIASIVAARQQVGGFQTIFDLLIHTDLRQVNKKALESLVQAGALDSLQGSRAQLFNVIEMAIEFAQNVQGLKNKNKNQRSLFDQKSGEAETLVNYQYPELPDIPEWPVMERLKKEKELLGLYISGHPLERYRALLSLFTSRPQPAKNDALSTPSQKGGPLVMIGGQVIEVRTMLDKKQQKMAFIKMEDINQTYEVIVFSSLYSQYETYLKPDSVVMVQGRSTSDADEAITKILAERFIALEKAPEEMTESILLSVNPSELNEEQLHRLKLALKSSPGKCRVYFELRLNGDGAHQLISNSFKINLTSRTLEELDHILGYQNIRIKLREK
jgi:DNA polymerase-3 subunit alpha